jgi:hypothetical protein
MASWANGRTSPAGGVCPGADALAGWLEGTLSPEERRPLAAHLASCDDCRRAVAVAATLGAPPEAAALDESLLARVVAASRRRVPWPWVAAAAALAVAVLVFAWPSRPRTETATEAKAPPAATIPEKARVFEETPLRVENPAPPKMEEAARPAAVPEGTPPPKKEETPRVEVAREPDPEPPPVKEPPSPPAPEAPAVARTEGPGKTVTDLSGVFASVFAVDPHGDLWLRRGRGEAGRAGAFETLAPSDSISARDAAATFTLEGRATVVLEKGAEAVFCFFKPERAYAVDVVQGQVMIDTEGVPQNWRASRAGVTLAFSSLNGRLALEPRGEQLTALLLEGRMDVRNGAMEERLEAGREVTSAAGGRLTVRRAETKKKLQRFGELHPRTTTVFSATFDEAGGSRPFEYSVAAGEPVQEGADRFLRGTLSEERGRTRSAVEVRAGRPVPVTSGLALRFRYRTTAASLTLRAGPFAAPFTSVPSGRWADGEVPLSALENEGVPPVPLEEIPGVRIEASFDGKSAGRLDLDGVYLIRRAR